jgi:UDPglucose--hexose-1-phosphate uridylyltransferase
LTGEWVLVSPHRLDRPWQGETQSPPPPAPAYDPQCYLCPGNTRAGGAVNPIYTDVFAFDNDYPALLPESAAPESKGLLQTEPETGICRVLCYAPDHHLTLGQMPPDRIRRVIDLWADQYTDLAARPEIAAVTIFENRGAMMGASNPHPHGQVWATSSVPPSLAVIDANQKAYFAEHGRPLLIDYLAQELADGARIVAETEHAVALVPFWAVWPYETMVLPRRPVSSLPEFTAPERTSLASLLKTLLTAYDRVFDTSAPYSLGWRQRPAKAAASPHFVAHLAFHPPLVRPPSVRKFMVGFEMFGMPQRDLTPETAAARLSAALPQS